MRKIVITFTLIFFFSVSFATAENLTPEKKADIKKLMEITGSIKLGKQISEAFIRQMTQAIKAARPDIPERMYTILEKEVNSVIDEQMFVRGGLLELTIIIYDKYYTHEDVRSLISFFETELGKKMIKVMPLIVQESMKAGQLWGQALGPLIQERLIERFKKEGVDLST